VAKAYYTHKTYPYQFIAYVTKETHDALTEICVERQMPISTLIRELAEKEVEKWRSEEAKSTEP